MANGRERFNRKRRFQEDQSQLDLSELAASVRYTGNPEHKRNPGNFGLTPPAQPRLNKTLCDEAEIFDHEQAERLLQAGIQRGLISEQWKGGFPQNIWAVTDGNVALEAQLENRAQGAYHGYPMPEADPFREEVLKNWEAK